MFAALPHRRLHRPENAILLRCHETLPNATPYHHSIITRIKQRFFRRTSLTHRVFASNVGAFLQQIASGYENIRTPSMLTLEYQQKNTIILGR
jgi:hypothetical protein